MLGQASMNERTGERTIFCMAFAMGISISRWFFDSCQSKCVAQAIRHPSASYEEESGCNGPVVSLFALVSLTSIHVHTKAEP